MPRSAAEFGLLTVKDVAERYGITEVRARALIRNRHQRFGIGWKVPGSRGTWLLTEGEVERLRPGPPGRPASTRSSTASQSERPDEAPGEGRNQP